MTRPDNNTGNYVPYPFQEECRFYNALANQYRVYAEDGASTFIVHIWEDKNVLLFTDISVKGSTLS